MPPRMCCSADRLSESSNKSSVPRSVHEQVSNPLFHQNDSDESVDAAPVRRGLRLRKRHCPVLQLTKESSTGKPVHAKNRKVALTWIVNVKRKLSHESISHSEDTSLKNLPQLNTSSPWKTACFWRKGKRKATPVIFEHRSQSRDGYDADARPLASTSLLNHVYGQPFEQLSEDQNKPIDRCHSLSLACKETDKIW